MSSRLTPENALIFRIVHRDNVSWILEHGLHCKNAAVADPNFRAIGNPELIVRRESHVVPIPPGGTLSDYVPFYFTPYSPMMLNIKTGFGGIKQVRNEDIVVMVTSLHRLTDHHVRFVFSDRHAYLIAANFFNDLQDLNVLDWVCLQKRDFRRDPDDPEKIERYQAEALVYQTLPVQALAGLVCYNEQVRMVLGKMVKQNGADLDVYSRPKWYFT